MGWCEVRAQEEIKLLWTELSCELSSWISSFSSREPQRAIPGHPSLLEQQQLGDWKKESGVAAAASQLWEGEEKVPDSQWITRVLLESVFCSEWKKLPPFPPPLFPTRRKSRLPLSAAGPGSGEWARRQRGPLDFLGMGLLTAYRRKKG